MDNAKESTLPKKLNWLSSDDIRPYVFVRSENRIKSPGTLHATDWFSQGSIEKLIYKDPLKMSEVSFANDILRLESQAFDASGMAMDRWVFYDCAVMPGFVTGFAAKAGTLSKAAKAALKVSDRDDDDWIPLSLFIIIPAVTSGEWVAHNLCSVNSLLSKNDKLWGLGFMSKAFGLWYANIKTCIGMTQWKSPAMKLHSHYGNFKIITAYTPVHTYAQTLTYRLNVAPELWSGFLGNAVRHTFKDNFEYSGFQVEPDNRESLEDFQRRIESGEVEYYLDAEEILSKPLDAKLNVYCPK